MQRESPPGPSYIAEHNRERLRRLIERSDDDFVARSTGPGRSLAYWVTSPSGTRALVLADKMTRGVPFSPSDREPEDVTWINDAMRPLTRDPARRADRRPRRFSRARGDVAEGPNQPAERCAPLHRAEHLDEIEAATADR